MLTKPSEQTGYKSKSKHDQQGEKSTLTAFGKQRAGKAAQTSRFQSRARGGRAGDVGYKPAPQAGAPSQPRRQVPQGNNGLARSARELPTPPGPLQPRHPPRQHTASSCPLTFSPCESMASEAEPRASWARACRTPAEEPRVSGSRSPGPNQLGPRREGRDGAGPRRHWLPAEGAGPRGRDCGGRGAGRDPEGGRRVGKEERPTGCWVRRRSNSEKNLGAPWVGGPED